MRVGNLPEALAFYEARLRAVFSGFGQLGGVSVHYTRQHPRHESSRKGSNVHWALVTFADMVSVDRVRHAVLTI